MSSYLFPKILPAPHTDQTWFCSPSTSLSIPTNNNGPNGSNGNNNNRQNRHNVQFMYTNLDALEQEEEQYSRKLHQIAHTPAPEPVGRKVSEEASRDLHRSFLETNDMNRSRRRRREIQNDGSVETDSHHSHDDRERYRMTTPTQQTHAVRTGVDEYPDGRHRRRRHVMEDDLDHTNDTEEDGEGYESADDYQDDDSSTVVANRLETYRSMSLTPSSRDQSQSLTSSLSLSSSMNHSMDR